MNKTHEDCSFRLPHCLFSQSSSIGDIDSYSNNNAYSPSPLPASCNILHMPPMPATDSSLIFPPSAATPPLSSSSLSQLSFPLSAGPMELPQIEPMIPPTRRRHRGSTLAEKLQRKAARAEKNRKFARESRERKRCYVQELEDEVAGLKAELEKYKERFSRYELVEKMRAAACGNANAMIPAALEEMARTGASREQFARILIEKTEQMIMERQKALEQLSRIMLEIMVPRHLRLCFWAAENDIDLYNPHNVCKFMGYTPTEEQMRALAEHLQSSRKESSESQRRGKSRIAIIAEDVRKQVKRMLECQHDVDHETMRIWKLGKKVFAHRYTPDFAANEFKFSPQLGGRPELSDCAIFQITEQDFSFDGGMERTECADEWEGTVVLGDSDTRRA